MATCDWCGIEGKEAEENREACTDCRENQANNHAAGEPGHEDLEHGECPLCEDKIPAGQGFVDVDELFAQLRRNN